MHLNWNAATALRAHWYTNFAMKNYEVVALALVIAASRLEKGDRSVTDEVRTRNRVMLLRSTLQDVMGM